MTQTRSLPRSVAVLGDTMNPNCFGGSPSHFFGEARRQGFADNGWRIDLDRLRLPRVLWNFGRVARGRRMGGFQFSAAGRAAAMAQVSPEMRRTEVISFQQHFPPPEPILKAGGEINYYIDATYTQLFATYEGWDQGMDKQTLREAIAYEREAFAGARRVIASQSWALKSLRDDYGLDPAKCSVVLPAANYPVHPGLCPERLAGRPGRDRPFVLGFIGKDWRRKGLMFLHDVATRIRSDGWKVVIRAIGFPSDQLPKTDGIECLGFIDKRTHFGPFLHGCDLGCLFSKAEAAGLAVLEFLGVGVPVAGFAVNGLADLLPAEAGFRFAPGTTAASVAEAFVAYLRDEDLQAKFKARARLLAPGVSWERCIGEFRELWAGGSLAVPFRLGEAIRN